MKVLHVIDKMDPKRGGVCQAVRTIIKGLALLEVESEVVSTDMPTETFLQQDQFITHALGPANNPLCYTKELKPWLVNNLNRFSVVIIHGLWQYPSYAVYKAKKYLNKKNNGVIAPRIYTMPHGMLDPYFQKAPERKLKAIRNVLYWSLIEKNVVNAVDGLLFTCEEEKQLARIPFKPYEPNSELVVGLGVEQPPSYDTDMTNAFIEKCTDLKGSSYFLFLSRIHQKKGVDILLKAYSEFSKQQLALDISIEIPKLVIAGPGMESNYGKQIERIILADELLQKNVLLPGMLSGNAKWGAFYGCKAFVLPSHQENFGIAIVEALACGRPILISNKINIWREIESGGGGFVATDSKVGTINLFEAYSKLDTKQWQQMSKKAVVTYEQYFAVESAAKSFLKAIDPT
ncbi:glycosyltransferase [Aurantibacter sp.]|uniref:glycosyltransferase n=1 Tax=Aurantibacter sp. TaxID=2807103 RepID=UPI0032630D96